MGNREGGAFLDAFPCGKQVEDEVVRVPSEPADRLGTPPTPAERRQETAGEAEVLLEGSTAGRKSQGSPGPRGWGTHIHQTVQPQWSASIRPSLETSLVQRPLALSSLLEGPGPALLDPGARMPVGTLPVWHRAVDHGSFSGLWAGWEGCGGLITEDHLPR